MKLGFTGSQLGVTAPQEASLRQVLADLVPTEGHHGLCVGADAAFHRVLWELFPDCKTVGYPPKNKRAYQIQVCDEMRQEKEYLDRNKNIVNETSILIACPATAREIIRSGTWSTVRYARKLKRPVWIIYPDGHVEKENETSDGSSQLKFF